MDRRKPVIDVVVRLGTDLECTRICLSTLRKSKDVVPFRPILLEARATLPGALQEEFVDGGEVLVGVDDERRAVCANIGAHGGDSPYILFLDGHLVGKPGWLNRLYAAIDSETDIGIATARLVDPYGSVFHAGMEIIDGAPGHAFRGAQEDDARVVAARDVDMATGSCLMIRRTLFEALGGFDEAYTHSFEDVDLCLRARDRGFRVRYVSDCVVVHHGDFVSTPLDQVQPDLQVLANRFKGRFDVHGRFIPIISSASNWQRGAPGAALRGIWEGTQFTKHSLSIVNTAMAVRLLRDERVELKLVPYETATFHPSEDPAYYGPIAWGLVHELSGPPAFHIRHKWPPDLSSPPAGHLILMQPWEFGRIPSAWIAPIQSRVDEVWVPSSYVKRCFEDSGIDGDRVQVVPNGVDGRRFNRDARPLPLQTDKKFKYLFVGGTIHRKGIDVLLAAYRRTFSAADDVCLVVKGVGTDTFYRGQTACALIDAQRRDPQAAEILHLTHDLSNEDLAGLYTACDCLVHPYRGEGFAMPVAEAMACGLPVIVTRGGATDDFCFDETAYFVEAEQRAVKYEEETAGPAWLLEPEIGSLAAQMLHALGHPDDARAKGRRGAAYVHEHLTWEHAARRALERLEIVCSKPIRRPGGSARRTPHSGGLRERAMPERRLVSTAHAPRRRVRPAGSERVQSGRTCCEDSDNTRRL